MRSSSWRTRNGSTERGDGVGRGVTRVTGDVGGRCGVTGGTGRGTCGRILGGAGRGVGSERRRARLAHGKLATRPSTRRFDGFARSVVSGVLRFEVREHALGGVRGPEGQGPVVLLVDTLGHRPRPQFGRTSGHPYTMSTSLMVPAFKSVQTCPYSVT